MNSSEIDECNRLIQEINMKRAKIDKLKELRAKKKREQFESVNSIKSTFEKCIKVMNEVRNCFAEAEKVTEAENDIKMFICSSEQAKLDVKSGSGSMLIASGTTRDSSRKLVNGLIDINSGELSPHAFNSAVEFAHQLTEHAQRLHLAAVTCATKGGLVRTEFN